MKTTPGYKTTEFWLTLLTVIGTCAGALEEAVPPKYAAVTSAIMISAYAIARGIKKARGRDDVTVIQNNVSAKKPAEKKPRQTKAGTKRE